MYRRIAPAIVVAMMGAIPVHADLLRFQASEFGVLAGQDISMGQGVRVTGRVGSLDDIWISHDSTITGGVYAQDGFSTGERVTMTGRVVAGDHISLGRQNTVGRLDVGTSGSKTDVYVGDDSVVGGIHADDDVSVGKNVSVTGDIHAGDDVDLNRNTVVHGDVTYAADFWKHSSATVDGTVTQGAADAPDSWTVADRDDSDVPALTHGSQQWYTSANQTATIGAGTYRDLRTGHDATLNLFAGEYKFRDVSLASGTKIVADTTAGDVIIIASDDFGLATKCEIEIIGDGDVWIYANDDINIGNCGTVRANLVAFDDMWIGHSSEVTGILYAQDNLSLGNYVVIVTDYQPVPEPGTIALLGFGGLGVLLRRHRRKIRVIR